MTRSEVEMLEFEIRFYERLVNQKPDFVDALLPLAECYTRKGWYDKGLGIDERLARLLPGDPITHYNLACSYALVGRKEKAMRALKRSIRLGYRDFDHLRHDDDLKILHDDPLFQKLIAVCPVK